MNKVILVGRLTRDPGMRVSYAGEKQISVTRYTLAVDRRVKKDEQSEQQTADFISCVAFDKAAEFASKYFRQGTKIAVSGHIQTGSYVNREGIKVYTTDVMIEEQEFAESKNAANSQQESKDYAAGQQADKDGFVSIPPSVDDEGLPF